MSCDTSGQCATIELLNGELVIHSQQDLLYPALTNHSYADSLRYFETLTKKPTRAKASLKRFAVAAQATQISQKSSLYKALTSLDKVKIDGYTKWQIAYDLKHKRILFRTDQKPKAREIDLSILMNYLEHKEGCSAQYTLPLSSTEVSKLVEYFKAPRLHVEKSNLSTRFKRLKLPKHLAHLLAEHGASCHISQ